MSFNIDSPYTFFHKEVFLLEEDRKNLDLSSESHVNRFELKVENLLEFTHKLSSESQEYFKINFDYCNDRSKLLKIAETFRDSVLENKERETLKSKSIFIRAFFEIETAFKKIGKFIWSNVQRVFPRDFKEIDRKVSVVYEQFKNSVESKNSQASPICNHVINQALHTNANDLAKVTKSIEEYKNSLGDSAAKVDFTKFVELADWIWNVYQDSSILLEHQSFRNYNANDYDAVRENLKNLETIYYFVVNHWIDTLEASAVPSVNPIDVNEAASSSSAVRAGETNRALSLPPPLLKWYENSCYRNAAYQAVFSCPHYYNQLNQLSQRLASREALDQRPEINEKIKALVVFFDYYRLLQAADRRDSKDYKQLQEQAMAAERRFRGLMYSESSGIFRREEELRMNDSNLFVSCGIMDLLKCEFRFKEINSGESEGDSLSRARENQISTMWDVHIPDVALSGNYNLSLEDLIHNTFVEEIDDLQRGWEYDDHHYFTQYSRKRELTTLPEVFPIHFVRQRKTRPGGEPLHVGKPVVVPLTLDMSSYVNREVCGAQPVNYELNSFVIYVGAHYISVVKRGNKWYVCDDADSRNNRELDQNSREFEKLKNTCYNCYYKRVY